MTGIKLIRGMAEKQEVKVMFQSLVKRILEASFNLKFFNAPFSSC